ncbi:MAG: DNA cytosine methyltransferase [Thermoplasmata archaeon]
MERGSVLDLFSGMGGFSQGFAEAGFSVTGVDLAEDAGKVYRRLPNSKFVNADLSIELIEGNYDYVIGGPPCKPWSSVNLTRRGDEHRDYKLVKKFADNVLSVSPRGFILENVPPLRNDLQFLTQMKRLEHAGYSVDIRVYRYSDYGAATSRRRMFAVGLKGLDIASFIRNLESEMAPAKTVENAIIRYRNYPFGRHPDHKWPNLKTIYKYADYYDTGKFGWTILEWSKPAHSFGNVMKTYTLHPDSDPRSENPRVVSPLEVSRIMGFNHGFRFPSGITLGRKYQMLADSVSPVFSEKIARAILQTSGNP